MEKKVKPSSRRRKKARKVTFYDDKTSKFDKNEENEFVNDDDDEGFGNAEESFENEDEQMKHFEEIDDKVSGEADSSNTVTFAKRKMEEKTSQRLAKRRKADTPKLPNAEEVNKWREIQFLYHSNIFRLQMNEMLSALEIKQKTKVRINSWIAEFSKTIKNLSKSGGFLLSNPKWPDDEGLGPLPLKYFNKLPPLKGGFTFIPPQEVLMVGSFPLGLATTHSKIVDVALVLPREFMQKNDLSDGRWLLRRALYLSWLAKELQSHKDVVADVSWISHCGSPLRPTLQVTPSGKLGNSWRVNLFPVPPEAYFKDVSISPIRNNVSLSWFYGKRNDEAGNEPPTPHHNWLCGVDVVMLAHHNFIKECLKHPNWILGAQLLKIWIGQRGFGQGEGSISSHVMTLFLVHLAKIHKISPQMSPYEVFRIALLQLSQTNWCSEGLTLYEKKPVTDRNQIILTQADFHPLYPVVFVDPTGYLNLTGNLSALGYLELQHQAKTGLEILQLSSTNSFDSLFIQKVDFHLVFDQAIHIRLTREDVIRIFREVKDSPEGEVADRLGDVRSFVVDRIVSTVSRGLGERVRLVGLFRHKNETWKHGSETPDLNYDVKLGLLLDPRLSTELLTKGPSADSSEAAEFRNFWGEISSLRRFKDSTFHEAVLWGGAEASIGDRRLIIGKILTYLMTTKFQLAENQVHYVSGQLENVLRMPYYYENDDTFRYGTGEEANTHAIVSFDSLSRKLRSLDLPLKIITIQSASEVLRHSAVYPPMSIKKYKTYASVNSGTTKELFTTLKDPQKACPLYTPSIEVQVFLEISGKWPDDLVAIRAIKAEFMCKMAQLLREEGITAVVLPSRMLVIWEGYVFSVKVCYRREIHMLKTKDDNTERDTDASLELLKGIEILPRLTSFLNSLQSDHPSYSGAVRLVKRWVSSQLLLQCFPHIVIDLLVARIYSVPQPYLAPNTPHVAFLRFIDFMAKLDAKSTPILINLREEFSGNDEAELLKRFTDHRSSFPPLFICTPCELKPLVGAAEPSAAELDQRYSLASVWTRSGPTLPILSRMKTVASAALETFRCNMWNNEFNFTVLFRPPLTAYDLLIYLDDDQLSRRLERLAPKKPLPLERYKHIKGEAVPVVDFDPAQCYLKQLRDSFDSHALFFHDEHGGNVIGVIWKPHVYEEKEPKMRNLEGHKLVGIQNVKQIVNLDGIVEEFALLGKGLVKEVKLKS